MKFFLSLLLSLMVSYEAQAQVINFPDPNFKNVLVNTNCVDTDGDGTGDADADANNDGEIEISEVNMITWLDVSEKNIKSLEGIDFITNLKSLDCSKNELTTLDVEKLKSLEGLLCMYNKIENLKINSLSNLVTLFTLHNNLKELDVSTLINLVWLDCSDNLLENLKIGTLPKLKKLSFPNHNIVSIKIQDCLALEEINCASGKLEFLELNNLPNLIYLGCHNNMLTSLSLKGVPELTTIICSQNQLTSLNLEEAKNLYSLLASNNKLEEVSANNLSNLKSLNFDYNDLKYLFIKTGNTLDYLSLLNNENLEYICCDEENINEIKYKALFNGVLNCEVNSYCTFTPGGAFYTINGQNKYDYNKNGCDDVDKKLPHLKYTISNGSVEGTILSNSTGIYSIPVQAGTHTITPVLENSEFFEVSPPSLTVTFPGTSDTITQNFCITPKNPFRQVNITIIPLTPPARPGFDAQYKIIWENKGNLFETGTIHFTYDENIFDYVSADETPDVINNGKLSWDYTDLLPFEKREIIVSLNLNSPMENPPVNAGDITYLYANILDNVFRLENVIVGSYDPNDKTCLQGQYFHPDSVGKYVDFLIRFENTGNFAAENVVIKDIIDDKTFDMPSLLITDASHEVFTRIAANKVEFIFENIQLPFEDETNDGYVAFKIKTKSTLKLGDEMKNLADIYFDYNFPIRTNETQTTIAFPSGTKDIQTEVTIHPNPVRDVLTLDSSTRWTKAEIFDISGRLIKVTGVDGFSVDVIGLDSGTYILHLSDKDKRGRVKFVKM